MGVEANSNKTDYVQRISLKKPDTPIYYRRKVMSQKDALASVIADELNKTFKHQKVAYFLDDGANPTDVVDWISTGSTMLDLAIANKPNAGVPVGKITELNGLEGSGKSLIGAHLLASTQKKGGVAVYIDAESAVNLDRSRQRFPYPFTFIILTD